METLDRQKLDVVNETRSNFFDWRDQFTPDSKPIDFERFGNCGGFATIKSSAGGQMNLGSNPVEFDGIKNSAERHFAWSTV